jgi:hypothetical protein
VRGLSTVRAGDARLQGEGLNSVIQQRVKQLFAQVLARSEAVLATGLYGAFEVTLPAASLVDTTTILVFQELVSERLASRSGASRVLAFRYKGARAELAGGLVLMFHAPGVAGVALAAALPVSGPTTERRFCQAVMDGVEFKPFKQRVQTDTALKLLHKALRKSLRKEISVCVLLGRAKRGYWSQAAMSLNLLPAPASVPVKLTAYLAARGAGLSVAGRRTERTDYARSSIRQIGRGSPDRAIEPLFLASARKLLRDPQALLWSLALELERAERIEVLCHARFDEVLVLLHFSQRSVKATISGYLVPLSDAHRERVFADLLHMLDYRHIGRQSPALLDSEGEFKRIPARKAITQLQAAIAFCE